MAEIPLGFCQCGCGEKTRIAPYSRAKKGWIKDEPVRFISGHNGRGDLNSKWKGGTFIDEMGYVEILNPGHPSARGGRYVREHILIAEKALGKSLPKGAEVHHFNGKPGDNSPGNLVICQNLPYHKLIHQRTMAHEACGHAGWRKCSFCKKYDSPENMKGHRGRSPYHVDCRNEYRKNQRRIKNHDSQFNASSR